MVMQILFRVASTTLNGTMARESFILLTLAPYSRMISLMYKALRMTCKLAPTRKQAEPREKMKEKVLLFITLALITSCATPARDDIAVNENATPTLDSESSDVVYIPKDLDDCFKELNKLLEPSVIEELKNGSEEDLSRYHFGLGMWIRNNWGVWGDSRLGDYFREMGIWHPDDMSSIILVSYWRHLNDRPIQLDEQVEFYESYWEGFQVEPTPE